MKSDLLAGLRLLVVEDEMLVLMLIEDVLTDLGCETVTTASRVAEAVALANAGTFDAAILDRNLAGEEVYPVADVLAARGVPFLFASGYGERGLREEHRNRPLLQKPFRADDLGRVLHDLVAATARTEGS